MIWVWIELKAVLQWSTWAPSHQLPREFSGGSVRRPEGLSTVGPTNSRKTHSDSSVAGFLSSRGWQTAETPDGKWKSAYNVSGVERLTWQSPSRRQFGKKYPKSNNYGLHPIDYKLQHKQEFCRQRKRESMGDVVTTHASVLATCLTCYQTCPGCTVWVHFTAMTRCGWSCFIALHEMHMNCWSSVCQTTCGVLLEQTSQVLLTSACVSSPFLLPPLSPGVALMYSGLNLLKICLSLFLQENHTSLIHRSEVQSAEGNRLYLHGTFHMPYSSASQPFSVYPLWSTP